MKNWILFINFFYNNSKALVGLLIITIIFKSIIAIYFFQTYFLTRSCNADEFYYNLIYPITNLNLYHATACQSQVFVFLSSIANFIISDKLVAPRLVSLLFAFFLVIYFVFKIKKFELSYIQNATIITMVISVIFSFNNMFIGTSDFMSAALLCVFIIEFIEIIALNQKPTIKNSLVLGLLLALIIFTRPTTVVILFFFFIFFILSQLKRLSYLKRYLLIFISCVFLSFVLNLKPLIENKTVLLDIKEVPKELGTSWLERNYLMAKFWDEGKIPNSVWLSSQFVVDYKKNNPNVFIPKSNLDLLINEPFFYFKQITKLFFQSLYSSFIHLGFVFLIFIFLSFKRLLVLFKNKSKSDLFLVYLFLFFIFSSLLFSYLAIKLFEIRWMIPLILVLPYFLFNPKSKFNLNNNLVYNITLMAFIMLSIKSLFFYKIL